jgi:hypothetical protein
LAHDILFVTWDGPQVDYLEGLFIPIFEGLKQHGYHFHVLQFTWGGRHKVERMRAICESRGLHYRAFPIVRFPSGLGAFLTAKIGGRIIGRAIKDWGISVLMPRSLMPALAALSMPKRSGLKVIFDADGFAADEKVEFAGASPHGFSYRYLRDVEAEMVRRADAVLVRTAAAVPILMARAGPFVDKTKFHVVSNGRKESLFDGCRAQETNAARPNAPLIGCFAGSMGPQYRPELMLDISKALKTRLDLYELRVFTPEMQRFEQARRHAGLSGVHWITVEHVAPSEIGSRIANCDFGFSLRANSFSTAGVQPIKVGEYLLCGLPILGCGWTHEIDELIEGDVYLHCDNLDTKQIVNWVENRMAPNLTELRKRARAFGLNFYSITRSIKEYKIALNTCTSSPFAATTRA